MISLSDIKKKDKKYFIDGKFAIEINNKEEVSFVDGIFHQDHGYLSEHFVIDGHCISVISNGHATKDYYENALGKPVMAFKKFKQIIKIKQI